MKNDAAPSRIERKRDRTRQTLISVALELLCEKGIYWITVEDITERADVGKGTFYQHFESKEDVLYSVLKVGLKALLDDIRGALAGPGDGDAYRKVVSAHLNFFLSHREYLLLFHQVRGLLQLKRGEIRNLGQIYDEFFDEMAAVLREALPEGVLGTVSARELAIMLSTMTTALLTHSDLFASREGALSARHGELERRIHDGVLAMCRSQAGTPKESE